MTEISDAMAAVVKAHKILADFHRELAAFYAILDDLLAQEGRLQLDPNSEYVVAESKMRLVDAASWAPGWYGRFYMDREAHSDDEEPGIDLAAPEKLGVVYVIVAAAPSALQELPGATEPECVFGIAHPGTGGKGKGWWDVARYGVWHYLPCEQLRLDDWAEGEFPEGISKFGTSSYWWGRRIKLSDLLNREVIASKIARPLEEKFAAKFKT